MSYIKPPAVTSAGGLQFSASHSPAGVGRLEYVPFELSAQGAAALAVPGQAAGFRALPILAGEVQDTILLQTPQISWAVFRVLGLVTTLTRQGNVTDNIRVNTLNLGGGPNLILSQNGSRAELYDIANERFAGLRDYPILRSPNQAFLNIQFSSITGAAAVGNNVLTAALVVDVLADDNFGAHLPGPYARRDSLIRRPVGRR